ncbi:unnamed protein product [Pylaiella littoralis]
MTFVYCEELGWVFLHQVTEEAITAVQDLLRTTHCLEMGVLRADRKSRATIEGLVTAFSSCDDVSIRIDGSIAEIAGTERQVYHVSRAIQAIDTSAQRLHTTAHWYYQGTHHSPGDPSPPWFEMDAEASRSLEEAFTHSRSINGGDCGVHRVRGVLYVADFSAMKQTETTTGLVRAIKRVITDESSFSLPQRPNQNVPRTKFREGSTVSLIDVSEEDEMMVRAAVTFTYEESAVMKVQHIWNSFLWEHYAQNAKTIGNECMLFHGARDEAINTIMREGFEKRLAGSTNGATYGQGCYFARDASLAARYMASYPSFGQMIMAKVLVGEHTKGNSSMLVPPKIASTERHYDTTSNHDLSPSLIVTYKDWQAYPMYLITFEPRPV